MHITVFADELKSDDGSFKIIFPPKSEIPAKAVLHAAEKCKETVESNLGEKIDREITILYAATQSDFLKMARNKNEHILAYANHEKKEILINGEALKSQGVEGLYRTLVHEYGHIWLGLILPEEIPRWLNEGLVMHLAGEGSFMMTMSVLKAHAFGNLIPLREIDMSFPSEQHKMELAYAESYSVTHFLISKINSGKDSLSIFIDRLADKEKGRERISNFWDPDFRDNAIETNWKASLGKRVWGWIFLFTSGSIFWFAVSVLFIIAYLRKRKIKNAKIKKWENEEIVYSSLTKDDEKEFWTPEDEDDEPWADPDDDEEEEYRR